MPSADHSALIQRIRPGILAATLLISAVILSVILQLLPAMSSQAADAAAPVTTSSSLDAVTVSVLPVFIGGAVLVILFVATVLIGYARKPGAS